MISHAKPVFLGLLGFLLWQCASTPKPQLGYYASGKPRYSIERDKDGRKAGLEKWWHENGQLKYQATFNNGFRHGKYSAFYPDGKSWYEGYEIMGRPESTLTYWNPNGQVRSKAFFRQGIQLSRQDYDENGQLLNAPSEASAPLAAPDMDAEEARRAAKARESAIQSWAKRVRTTVESHWVVPKQLAAKGNLKAVASVKVRRDGHILEIGWRSKSPVSSFNTLAANTFKKLKKLPPFPPEVKDSELEIEYAFVSSGKGEAKKRLEAGTTFGDLPAHETHAPDSSSGEGPSDE
jgi:TonB C terminal/MORN repeat variant